MKSRYHVGDRVLFSPHDRVGIEHGEYSAKVIAIKEIVSGRVNYRIHFDRPLARRWDLGGGHSPKQLVERINHMDAIPDELQEYREFDWPASRASALERLQAQVNTLYWESDCSMNRIAEQMGIRPETINELLLRREDFADAGTRLLGCETAATAGPSPAE